MQRMKTFTILAFLGASLAVGCNVSTTGNEGKVAFTPRDCGLALSGCDFSAGIGIGGVLNVQISGLGGFATAGVNLESSDLEVLDVAPTSDVDGEATWSLNGLNPGTARLMAIDGDGIVADYIDVDVVQPDRLTLLPLGNAVGPTFENPDFDEVWQINANERVVFQATPVIGVDSPVMGRYEYAAVLDEAMLEMVDAQDLLSQGRLDFTPTAPGSYSVIFNDNFGNGVIALIEVADTL